MDIKTFTPKFLEYFGNLGYDIMILEQKEFEVSFAGNKLFDEIDRDCGLSINVFQDEEEPDVIILNVIFMFDVVNPTLEFYDILNDYNVNVPFFKGFVSYADGKPILGFQLTTLLHGNNEEVISLIDRLQDEFISEQSLYFLINLFSNIDEM